METGYAVAEQGQFKSVQKKKPGFIKRWFAKMSREVWEESNNGHKIHPISRDEAISLKRASIGIGPVSIDQPERAIQFTVHVANGGRIVETRKVDRKTERSITGLYIITNDQKILS